MIIYPNLNYEFKPNSNPTLTPTLTLTLTLNLRDIVSSLTKKGWRKVVHRKRSKLEKKR
jgi:hypothetical protein